MVKESVKARTAEQVRAAQEAATAGREDLMEAMIAACAIIADADGHIDDTERRRTMQLMRAIPSFKAFSAAAIAEEFTSQERAFAYEPQLAREKALDAIEALKPHPSQVRMLLAACVEILEADGVRHPKEYEALHAVSKALGAA